MNRLAALLLAALFFLPAALSAKQTRILGGAAAPAGAYPFMVAVVDKFTADNFQAQFAGGSLIHPRWVLTAAHIVEGLRAGDMQVIVGPTDLGAAGLQRINVLEIVRHPAYVPTGFDFDVSLLLLATPVAGATPVEIISDAALAAPETTATVLGWGSLSDAENDFGTAILQSVDLPIVDQDLANSAPWHAGALTPNMLAAGPAEGGKDSCSGDSGGPLLVHGSQGQWVQAGIVSWGDGCGVAMKPGVYTRVSKFRQWIQSYVWPDFFAWEVRNGVDNDDGSDLDGDGASQWQEYAFARNPARAFDAIPLLLGGSGLDAGQRYPTLKLRRPVGGGNLSWSLQQSANLQTWTTLSAATQLVGTPAAVPGDTTLEDITWRGVNSTASSFLRAVAVPGKDFYISRRPLAFPGAVTHVLHAGDTLSGTFRTRDYLLTGLPVGQSVSLTLRSSDFNPVLLLVNADTGAVITTSNTNTGGNVLDEKITFTPAANTRYAARVTTQLANATGEFTLAVFQLKTGVTSITGAQTINGTLSVSDPADPFFPDATYYADDYIYTSTSSAGGALTVFLTSAAFSPDLSVINAETGERLFSAAGLQSSGGYSLSAMLTFIPRQGVPYYLRASSGEAVATGAYSIKTAATLTLGTPSSRSGTFSTTDGIDPYWVPNYSILADDYQLTGANAGIARTITATSTDNLRDMVVEVLDAGNGASVSFSDETLAGEPEVLVFTPVTGHSYIIRVSAYDETDAGPYSIQVQ